MFGGSGKRRGFVRTDISGAERTLSYLLLVLIVGIGVAIFTKGQVFDPGLFALDPTYIETMPQARESIKLYEPGFGPQGEIAAGPTAESGLFTDIAPDGQGWVNGRYVEVANVENVPIVPAPPLP